MFDRKKAYERASELVKKMTIEEKISQLRYDAPSIPRLGIPAYNWWNEALHGVARSGTATSFPQAIGMAAAFDTDLMEEVGDAISTEARARYNEFIKQEDRGIYKGLTFWSPNINIFRDPRWGRGHETYGEDPMLTGALGKSFIKGLQGDGEVMKAAACAKHYGVHSGPEDLRHQFNAEASEKDMWETYLPAFEECVTEGDVEAVMGAYNRTNGEPCCGSRKMLSEILRGKWNFKGHVVSDFRAIMDFHEGHKVTKDTAESAAMALNNGCNLNAGVAYRELKEAYDRGLVTEEAITEAAVHVFSTRMLLGMFEETEYDKIPYEKVECKEHLELSEKAAVKSIVLLKNEGGLLPLDKNKIKTLGIIGPNANSRLALKANYYGTSSRYITILEGIQDEAGEDVRVLFAKGCEIEADRTEGLAEPGDRLAEAVIVAEHSDVVVLCLGLDERLEGEERDEGNHVGSGDKADLQLPEVQRELLEKIVETGKPIVLCLMAGSAIDLSYAKGHCGAILDLWYPGARGGRAAAEILFGKHSPSGKLPLTFYKDCSELPDFTDYSMKNRTYKFYTGEPVYPFGYGLTYGDVVCTEAEAAGSAEEDSVIVRAKFENKSDTVTEDVAQVYVKCEGSEHAPVNPVLCGFKRFSIGAGEVKEVEIPVRKRHISVITEAGERILEGKPVFYVSDGQPDKVTEALTGKAAVQAKVLTS